MNSLDKQIRDRIAAFAEELAQLVKEAALESIHEALGQPGKTSSTRRPRKAATGRRLKKKATASRRAGKRIRRTPAQLTALSTEILAFVKSNPGQRLEQIARELGMDTAEMKRPVSLMMEAKKLSTKGQKRGTTYFAGAPKGRRRKKAAPTKARKKKAKRA